MALHQDVLAEVESLPEGPQIGAFFDFDGTVIAGYSAISFLREQLKRGDLSPLEFAELAIAMTKFGMGNAGFSAMMVVTTQFMKGYSEENYVQLGKELYQKHIAKLIYPESRALIKAHLKKGHTVAIISSATPFQVEPAAEELGISNVLCTRMEVKDGEFTGDVIHPTCFGPGKLAAAKMLAEKFGAALEDSFFYSDSDDDIELLDRVGNPRPLNPNRKLTAIAKQRDWPIQRFTSRGRPSLRDWTRSIAATGSILTSFAAGLPIWALTGSRREAQNFSFSLFADTASAIIGMDLKIKGENYLWKHRPAVFIFNHQSKADVIIAARLLRRDIAGVGKEEIKDTPFIGQVMHLSGVVFVDRQNTHSAVESMQPLVDVIREERKSVVLAPEGTRAVSPKLGPFKKGAFHLAMQAGVPIIPIVIHNALDVSPKGDFIFHSATVEVEVLPPVDTHSWKVETLSQHVEDVRNMYLEALGQDTEGRLIIGQQAQAKTKAKTAAKRRTASKPKAKPMAASEVGEAIR